MILMHLLVLLCVLPVFAIHCQVDPTGNLFIMNSKMIVMMTRISMIIMRTPTLTMMTAKNWPDLYGFAHLCSRRSSPPKSRNPPHLQNNPRPATSSSSFSQRYWIIINMMVSLASSGLRGAPGQEYHLRIIFDILGFPLMSLVIPVYVYGSGRCLLQGAWKSQVNPK